MIARMAPKKKKTKRRGRPGIYVRIDPARRDALAQTAELYGVSVAAVARAFIEVEQDAPRVEQVKERLRFYDRQLGLALEGGRHARTP